MKFILILLVVSFSLLLSGCRNEGSETHQFSGFNIYLNGAEEIVMSGLDRDIVEELKADSMSFEQWSNFFAVYPDTSDTEMRDFQDPLSGSYELSDDRVVFRPAQGFAEGRKYFARCYAPDLLEGTVDLLRSGKLIATSEFIEYRFVGH